VFGLVCCGKIADLRQSLTEYDGLVGLCWYGDHVPIMPAVYQQCGYPTGEVDFFFWQNRALTARQVETCPKDIQGNLSVHSLSTKWISMMGLI
jgi:hypothetical protein